MFICFKIEFEFESWFVWELNLFEKVDFVKVFWELYLLELFFVWEVGKYFLFIDYEGKIILLNLDVDRVIFGFLIEGVFDDIVELCFVVLKKIFGIFSEEYFIVSFFGNMFLDKILLMILFVFVWVIKSVDDKEGMIGLFIVVEILLVLLFDVIIVLFGESFVVCNKEVYWVKFRFGEIFILRVFKLLWILVEVFKLFFVNEYVILVVKFFCVVVK